MIKVGVIGWPVKHSRSPLIHNYWIKQNRLDATYESQAVDPASLKDFIRNLYAHGFSGCNVTIPHKEAALAFVDHYDECVAQTGSLNTIYLMDGKIRATSTDGEGFYNNLLSKQPQFKATNKIAVMIGAGGSAKAICDKLLKENIHEIHVLNRTESRILDLQHIFGSKIKRLHSSNLEKQLTETDLLINTTSLGMIGQPELQIDLSHLPARAIVADIVYVPLKTALIKTAEARGLIAVPGLGMLLHQAVEGFRLWFGLRPEVTKELYHLVETDILREHPQ
ncbi:MAG: shikimate dehydrogenase [Alphaproteobacteria bacterium]|nr:shikimate dehydrogenase [Alphaproteobacteria bacterium]